MLGSDKLKHFSEMLGLQHLDVPHLWGRASGPTGGEPQEEAEEDVESTEEVDKSGRAGAGGKGGKVKKDKADRKKKLRGGVEREGEC